ncbi:MAG: DUF4249 domain-containing protein [Pseudobacter sp.]|uniref:DUF4249 domain-containing protein n=1 Tax=Pseudobacter sp. TaxID=2045420 RepID=UPI003F8166A4
MRMTLQRYYVFLLIVLLAGCKKNFFPDTEEDDKLVVLSEATAGDIVRIPVARTIRAGSGNLIQFEKINDATVVLSEESGGKWLLRADKSQQSEGNPASIFYIRQYFKPNTTYTLEISHPVLGNARAVTRIPDPVQVITLDTSSELRQGKPVLQVKLILKDLPDQIEGFVIEAVKQLLKIRKTFNYQGVKYDCDTEEGKKLYEKVQHDPAVKLHKDTIPLQKFLRLNLYSRDLNIENLKFDGSDNAFRRIFLSDVNFLNNRYELTFSIDKEFFVTGRDEQKGRVLLQVKSASRELYKYLITYEKYKTDFGSIPANQLSSPAGNVQFGLGVFGGSTQVEKMYYFDDL